MTHDAQQDLATIRRIMEESRQEVGERGLHLVVWGLLATVGLVVTYLGALGRLDPGVAGWIWPAVLAVGWAASMLVGWREGRSATVRTVGRRVLSGTGVGMGITLSLIGMAGVFSDVVDHRALPGLLSLILAGPVLVTALLTGQRWLRGVAAAWWLGGAVMLFAPGLYTLPLMAGMTLLLMAVPGAVLNARSRPDDSAPGAVTGPA